MQIMQKTANWPGQGMFACLQTHRPVAKMLLVMRRPHSAACRKLLLAMRLTFLLLTTVLMSVHASVRSQSVTLSGVNLPLKQVFSAIERQTGYVVFSNRGDLNNTRPVSLDVQNMPLIALLDFALRDQPLSYIIEGKTIVLSLKPVVKESVKTEAPVADFRGQIKDPTGRPVPRATITIRGTGKVILADDEGRFNIPDLPEDATIEISAVGFTPMALKINGGNVTPVKIPGQPEGGNIMMEDRFVQVFLARSISPLDEVQVIAYGQTTRRMSLGNITTIRSEEIEKQPVNNVLLALQGRVPGMQINTRTGSWPGATPEISIRGINSIDAGKSPLFILNGVPVPESMSSSNGSVLQSFSSLYNINPADIESVDVLKDAEATAIYGSRGANGVILITTKKGKAGRTNVNVNAYTGFAEVAKRLPYLNIHQYNAMRREAYKNDGITPTPLNAADLFTWDTVNVRDWQQELLSKATTTKDLNVSVSGGDEHTSFLVGTNYHSDGIPLPGDFESDRKSVRLSLDHRSPNGKIGISGTAAYSNSRIGLMAINPISYISLPPSYPILNADGSPNYNATPGYIYAYEQQPYDNTINNFSGNISFRYTPIKNLDLKVTAGLDNTTADQLQKTPASSLPANQQSSMSIRNATNSTWIMEPQAEYKLRAGRHGLTILAGGTWQQSKLRSMDARGSGFTSDALLGNISSAANITTSNNASEYAYNSFFSRLSYNWNEEYLLNLSFRRDGSSRFGPGKRFGNFGAVAAGWVFTKNSAIRKAMPFLSFGKLRASYGLNGNDQINDYGYITTYNNSQPYQGPSLVPGNLANPDYRWEENRKLEAALEVGFLNDRFLLSTSWFRNRTDNQLIDFQVSPQSGFGGYSANFPALLQNTGWEFQATSRNIATTNFTWKTMINFSLSRNKLLDFPNIEQTSFSSQYFVGYPLSVMQAYHFVELNNKGVPVLEDRTKNGSISSDDRYIIGSNNPLFGGMSNDFTYRNFSLGVMLEYNRFMGFDNTISAARVGGAGNVLSQVLDRWQKPGDEAFTNTPRFTTSSATYNARFYSQSDLFWRTYHILRLRNVSFSYDLPVSLLRKAGIRKTQLYMHAQNLWVADRNKYRFDPESGNQNLPPLRTFTFGINCTL